MKHYQAKDKHSGCDVTGQRLYGIQTQRALEENPSYRLFKLNTGLEWYGRHLGEEPCLPAVQDKQNKKEQEQHQ